MATRSARRGAGTPRRKRVWARQGINSVAVTVGAPAQINLLGSLQSALGGATPLGATVGPVILSGLQCRTSSLVEVTPRIVLGVTVASVDIEAVDQDPAVAHQHLDWMLWSAFPAPSSAGVNLVIGDGPDGSFRTASMRKLEEVQQTLWLVAGTPDTGTFNVRGYASTLVILP